MKPEYVLDGRHTTTLEQFYSEIGRVLLDGQPWGESLNDLDEILSGHYGLLPRSFRLVWCHVDIARIGLGYAETVHQLTQRLRDCHPTVLIKTAWALRSALREQGPTVYDWIVEIISNHPNVKLILVESDLQSDA
ncbi:barstar family protein [Leptolyngbya sp. FACHB-17]|uniref:barstar family protein n=1 Tax=unclassified Leptolyngbya TaxID=2650499 RepID=UPI0016816B0E|nr:barstar family protein [Leptolyngbya sp. FACHB-17]